VERISRPLAPDTVAVLPLLDMSEKNDQEYLSDGMSEDLINQVRLRPITRIHSQVAIEEDLAVNQVVIIPNHAPAINST
jgi:TolB-like protein